MSRDQAVQTQARGLDESNIVGESEAGTAEIYLQRPFTTNHFSMLMQLGRDALSKRGRPPPDMPPELDLDDESVTEQSATEGGRQRDGWPEDEMQSGRRVTLEVLAHHVREAHKAKHQIRVAGELLNTERLNFARYTKAIVEENRTLKNRLQDVNGRLKEEGKLCLQLLELLSEDQTFKNELATSNQSLKNELERAQLVARELGQELR